MKIKKKLLATVLLGCVLSGSALADKVTYDKAVADSKAYQDSLPHYENERSGLGPDETGGENSANKMGKWVKLGSSTMLNAGQYASVLAPSATGKSCLKGEKGFIASTRSKCVQWNSGGSFCYKYETSLSMDNGFKAECR
ncbi:hypothetical protein [Aliivibrio fischeri]|uniref:Uncharacterized protein n=1 Tax=Aliivibrio fischeri TaxID=668 RepID=A0A510UN15_ALIFS|nr:hypothetical protein [Aliivibrio fischeri]GEK16038.1 hypothetical protein AFI02nite_40740 [Aliivibrio fischeri]